MPRVLGLPGAIRAIGCAAVLVACAPPQHADPLAGVWRLDLARTHSGGGADHRREETMACGPIRGGMRCTITSVRSDGRRLVGRFAAQYGGPAGPVTGIPEMDGVTLRRAGERAVDATFTRRGTPGFAYRAEQSPDGRTLTVVSVDPVTRARLRSVVVYDRVR